MVDPVFYRCRLRVDETPGACVFLGNLDFSGLPILSFISLDLKGDGRVDCLLSSNIRLESRSFLDDFFSFLAVWLK